MYTVQTEKTKSGNLWVSAGPYLKSPICVRFVKLSNIESRNNLHVS